MKLVRLKIHSWACIGAHALRIDLISWYSGKRAGTKTKPIILAANLPRSITHNPCLFSEMDFDLIPADALLKREPTGPSATFNEIVADNHARAALWKPTKRPKSKPGPKGYRHDQGFQDGLMPSEKSFRLPNEN
jgi:hypothetical protein